MNSKRMFYIMIGAMVLVISVGVASVVLGNIILQKQSAKLVSLKLDNRVLDEQQRALVQANKDVQKYTELKNIAKTIVPQDKDQAKSVREIVQIAEDNKVPIASF